MHRITHAVLLVLFLMSPLCGTGGNIVKFVHESAFSSKTRDLIKSNDRIDREKTWQVFFLLVKPEDCIKIIFKSSLPDTTGKTAPVKTFFIVEKIIDISRFNKKGGVMYSEIGRNFDSSWSEAGEIMLCSSKTDPIKILSKAAYRIRFTALTAENFTFEVTVKSNRSRKIGILENLP
jgi:hypothetical protein